jgi:hypothetical protein
MDDYIADGFPPKLNPKPTYFFNNSELILSKIEKQHAYKATLKNSPVS